MLLQYRVFKGCEKTVILTLRCTSPRWEIVGRSSEACIDSCREGYEILPIDKLNVCRELRCEEGHTRDWTAGLFIKALVKSGAVNPEK